MLNLHVYKWNMLEVQQSSSTSYSSSVFLVLLSLYDIIYRFAHWFLHTVCYVVILYILTKRKYCWDSFLYPRHTTLAVLVLEEAKEVDNWYIYVGSRVYLTLAASVNMLRSSRAMAISLYNADMHVVTCPTSTAAFPSYTSQPHHVTCVSRLDFLYLVYRH